MFSRNGKIERGPLNPVISENIEALLELRRQQQNERTASERATEGIGSFIGSIPFVVLQSTFLCAWFVINTGVIPGVRPFDPYPFTFLAVIVSAEAIYLSVFILMKQNRLSEQEAHESDLDVQVNLLAEHELTRLIEIVDAMAKHLNVPVDRPPELESLKKHTSPTEVLRRIEEASARKGIRKKSG